MTSKMAAAKAPGDILCKQQISRCIVYVKLPVVVILGILASLQHCKQRRSNQTVRHAGEAYLRYLRFTALGVVVNLLLGGDKMARREAEGVAGTEYRGGSGIL